jgi:hypothetical protein
MTRWCVCRRKILTMGLLSEMSGFCRFVTHFILISTVYATVKIHPEFPEPLSGGSRHRRQALLRGMRRWVDRYEGFCRPPPAVYVFTGWIAKRVISRDQNFQYSIGRPWFAVRFVLETVHHFYRVNLLTLQSCCHPGSDSTVSYKG